MTARAVARSAAVPPWRDARVIRIATQVAVVAAVAVVIAFLLRNLLTAMDARGLAFTYGFLDNTAGFEIAESPVPYRPTDTYGWAFVAGLLNTLFVSVVGIILATILGVVVGVARLSGNWLVRRVAGGYVELIRNTPLLLQLLVIYFAVLLQLPGVANSITLPGSIFLNQRGLFVPAPQLTETFGIWLGFLGAGALVAVAAWVVSRRRSAGATPTRRIGLLGLGALLLLALVGWFVAGGPLRFEAPIQQRFNFTGGLALSPEFTALLTGLVIYTAAFIGEVVRGGIQAVRRGQLEAARSLGLTEGQTLRLIVFPQALRVIVPPLTSQYLNLVKNSSLAIAIGYPDLFKVGTTMANQTGQPVPVIVLVMGTYLAISLATSLLMNIYNRRVQVLER